MDWLKPSCDMNHAENSSIETPSTFGSTEPPNPVASFFGGTSDLRRLACFFFLVRSFSTCFSFCGAAATTVARRLFASGAAFLINATKKRR